MPHYALRVDTSAMSLRGTGSDETKGFNSSKVLVKGMKVCEYEICEYVCQHVAMCLCVGSLIISLIVVG